METNPTSPMSPEQGIRIIETMLARTQQKLQDNGLMYRLWGYLVFVAAIIHYAGITLWHNHEVAIVWAIMMPLGGLLSWYLGRKANHQQPVRTYMDELLQTVLITFFVSMGFSLLFGMAFTSWNVAYAFLMLAYGSWLFISGALLRFKALKVGGVINWLAGVSCFFIEGPQCLLVLAFAVLAGYIIPGHLIQQKFQQENGKN